MPQTCSTDFGIGDALAVRRKCRDRPLGHRCQPVGGDVVEQYLPLMPVVIVTRTLAATGWKFLMLFMSTSLVEIAIPLRNLRLFDWPMVAWNWIPVNCRLESVLHPVFAI